MEATRVAREAYITAKQNYDNCIMRPAPSECTIPETNRRKGAMDRASKDYEAAAAKMPSDPRSEPKDAPTRPGQPNAEAMAAAHSKVVSCRKDTAPTTCTKPDSTSAAGKAREKKIADYERKSATQKSCTTGFLNSNLSGSCKSVSSLKVGTLELKCKPATTVCNPWMYGASGSGSGIEAICGDVPEKGTSRQKAVEIAKSCGEKSGKVANAVDNFLANSKVDGVKEGWDAKLRQPLNQLCGGPLRMQANCELCQKLASAALLSISRSGAVRKCDAVSGVGAESHPTVK